MVEKIIVNQKKGLSGSGGPLQSCFRKKCLSYVLEAVQENESTNLA